MVNNVALSGSSTSSRQWLWSSGGRVCAGGARRCGLEQGLGCLATVGMQLRRGSKVAGIGMEELFMVSGSGAEEAPNKFAVELGVGAVFVDEFVKEVW